VTAQEKGPHRWPRIGSRPAPSPTGPPVVTAERRGRTCGLARRARFGKCVTGQGVRPGIARDDAGVDIGPRGGGHPRPRGLLWCR
jgi:hypothetical protein